MNATAKASNAVFVGNVKTIALLIAVVAVLALAYWGMTSERRRQDANREAARLWEGVQNFDRH